MGKGKAGERKANLPGLLLVGLTELSLCPLVMFWY